jgi:hypothetical protein
MIHLKRFLWLSAWSVWIWLGFGLYRELPRDLGPSVCRLPLGEQESEIGFVHGRHQLVTEERLGENQPIIIRLWNAETGLLDQAINGPLDIDGGTSYYFLERESLVVAKARPPLNKGSPSPGPSLLDLRAAKWRDLPTELRGCDVVFHDVKPSAIFYAHPRETDKSGRVAIVDLRSGKILFRWNPRWNPGLTRELGGPPIFIGDALIGIPTRNPWKEVDYVGEEGIELWSMTSLSGPRKVIDNLDVGDEPSISHSGRIACGVIGSDFVDVYDVHKEAYVFSHPPHAERTAHRGGFGGGWSPPRLSHDGASVLSVMHRKLWDVDTGSQLWAARTGEFFVSGEATDRFQLREEWSVGVGRFRKYYPTYAVRDLRSGTLIFRCWDSTLPPYDAVSSDRSLIYDTGSEQIRRMPPGINYPLLALCQTILALPLILLWVVLRWRRKRQAIRSAST